MLIAPEEIISLASLLLETILLSTNKSISKALSFTSNLGTSFMLSIISSAVNSQILSENKDSEICKAFLYSSSPCKNVIISLANAFWAFLSSGCSFRLFSNSSISSLVKNVNFFKYSITLSSSALIKYWYNSYGLVLLISNHNASPDSPLPILY